MTNRNKVILGVVALVALGIFIAKKLVGGNSSTLSTPASSGNGGSDVGSSSTVVTVSVFPLSKAKRSGYNGGAEATAVKQLQRWLNATAWRYGMIAPDYNVGVHDTVTVDGKFGANTENALMGAIGSKELSYTQYQTRRIYEY